MSVVSVLSRRGLLLMLLACALSTVALPQPSRAEDQKKRTTVKDLITFTWSVSPEDQFAKENAVDAKPEFKRGETFFLTITGKPKEGYHTYPVTKKTLKQGGGNTKLTYPSNESFTPLWPIIESEPAFVDEGEDAGGVNVEHEKPFYWMQEILVNPDAKTGAQKLRLSIDLQVCDQKYCTPGTIELEIPITVGAGDALVPSRSIQEKMKSAPPGPQVVAPGPDTTVIVRSQPKRDETSSKPIDYGDVKKLPKASDFKAMSLFEFVFSGVWFGLISLVTPCVFPMIPITVSFFLKQSEKKHNSPLALASVYSGTIVTVLTIGGLVLSTVLAIVSQHWITNLILGLLFLFFALSLFGMYEIMLPTSLVNFTSAREGQGGLAGTFFMALTFTIISFACVAPFYGSFLAFVSSASGAADWFKLLFGALAYSVTFASPFFVLALFPTLLRAMPRSGSWMNTIKVVMGFVEVAAAVKFLRSAELAFFKSSNFLTFDLSLGIYVALCILCGLYLLNFYRLPHDHEPLETIGVPRAMFAVLFIGLGLYMAPALLKQPDGDAQKPGGAVYAWIEAFLLPDENKTASASSTNGTQSTELAWSGRLEASLHKAEDEKKLVFIDLTAIVCTNCRYNERTVFKQPEIIDLLGKYVLVKLYTDGIPNWMEEGADSAEHNKWLQTKVFDVDQLPVYVILKPTGNSFEVLDQYREGKINSAAQFADFLKRHLSQTNNNIAARGVAQAGR
jgi:thiol:disulfide interchange protein DsbD